MKSIVRLGIHFFRFRKMENTIERKKRNGAKSRNWILDIIPSEIIFCILCEFEILRELLPLRIVCAELHGIVKAIAIDRILTLHNCIKRISKPENNRKRLELDRLDFITLYQLERMSYGINLVCFDETMPNIHICAQNKTRIIGRQNFPRLSTYISRKHLKFFLYERNVGSKKVSNMTHMGRNSCEIMRSDTSLRKHLNTGESIDVYEDDIINFDAVSKDSANMYRVKHIPARLRKIHMRD